MALCAQVVDLVRLCLPALSRVIALCHRRAALFDMDAAGGTGTGRTPDERLPLAAAQSPYHACRGVAQCCKEEFCHRHRKRGMGISREVH